MGCNIPPSSVIPAVAARLKYYVGVQRKEVGFDASARQGETIDNYRLYQVSKSDAFPHNQRITKKFLDNQMEASLRLYYGKSDAELNENFQIDPERKRHMQRKIKNKMSSIIIPDYNTSNSVYPRRVYGIERSPSDMERIPAYPFDISPPDMSPDEITRLISSAAELIVVTTSRKQRQRIPTFQMNKPSSSNRNNGHRLLPHRQMYKSDSFLKKEADPSRYSLCLKIPSSLQDSSPSSQHSPHCETTNSGSKEDTDMGVKMNQTENGSDETDEEETEYEISVHTGFSPKSETKQVLLIRLVGENGKTKKQALENSSTNPIPFCAGQVDIFNLKTKDIGKLKHLEIRTKQKDTHCRILCRDITVTKLTPGDEKYTFQCDQWISPIKTVVHKEHTKTRASTGNVMPAPPADGRKSRKRKEKPQTPGAKIKQDKGGKDSSLKQKKKAEMSCGRTEASKQMDSGVSRATSSKPKSEFIKSGGTAFTSQFIMKVSSKPEETKDCLMDKCPLGEKNSTDENYDSNINEQIQGTTQEVKGQGYRKASSPGSYVFFSHEMPGESSLTVEPSSGFPRNNTIIPNIPVKKELQVSEKEDPETHWFDNNEQKDQASQMTELQQSIWKPVIKLIGVSVRPDSENLDSNLQELKKGDSQDTNDESHEKLQRFLLPQTPQISEDHVLEDGDESNYASDTTLDEEFLFSDWSMSSSENEEDSDGVFSKSESSASQSETRVRGRDLRRRVRNPIPKENKEEVERNSSDVYQRALRAINSDDANLLRNLCRQHFFLLSCVDEEERTLLHHASSQGNEEICQVLLDTAVGMMNLDKEDIYGKTALHYAAVKNNDKTMKLLMKNGAK